MASTGSLNPKEKITSVCGSEMIPDTPENQALWKNWPRGIHGPAYESEEMPHSTLEILRLRYGIDTDKLKEELRLMQTERRHKCQVQVGCDVVDAIADAI